jgi:hypothetical protein
VTAFCVGIQRRHGQGEAQILLYVVGYGVEVRHAGAEPAQGDVLDVLRPDRRKFGEGSAAGGDPGGGQNRTPAEPA